jgi:hypothetical protein
LGGGARREAPGALRDGCFARIGRFAGRFLAPVVRFFFALALDAATTEAPAAEGMNALSE